MQDVAAGIKAAGVARKDIFITSKVAPSEQGFDGSYFDLCADIHITYCRGPGRIQEDDHEAWN